MALVDQLSIDTKIKYIYPTAFVGQKFNFGGTQYTYKGTDIIADQIDDLSRGFGDIVHTSNARAMLMNPTGYRPQPFMLDPSIKAALAGNLAGAVGGEVGVALSSQIAQGAFGDALKGSAGDIIGGLAGAGAGAALGGALGGRTGAIVGGLTGALSSGLGDTLGGLAGNFMPPGLDGPISAVTGAIKGLVGSLPIKAGGAADIVNKILVVKSLMKAGVPGLLATVGSNLLSDIPGADALASAVNLQSQVASLAGLAGNPIAFAAQAALMQQQFPMINMNKLAAKMIAGAAIGALGGKGFNINGMVPNLAIMAGSMLLKALPGKTPTRDAPRVIKTPKPPKPVKPIQLRNLFAEAAAGSAISTLTQPLSSFMGLMSSVAPAALMVASTAAATSAGRQKLNTNANTVNWGSGGYGRNNELVAQENKRIKMTELIERHTAELLASTDYSKLTKYSYPDLIKKYPKITPNMTVIEALAVIEETDKKAANTMSTMTG